VRRVGQDTAMKPLQDLVSVLAAAEARLPSLEERDELCEACGARRGKHLGWDGLGPCPGYPTQKFKPTGQYQDERTP
jgi:hypothetical protein